MEEVFIEFYRGKDEQAFLDAWKEKHGSIADEEVDALYEEIADVIDKEVKNDTHELGKVFEYKGVAVGKSDYNAFYNLYLFEAE